MAAQGRQGAKDMNYQTPKNLSAHRHQDWEVRAMISLGGHIGVGGTAQLFEFRQRGENAVYPFAFLGFGVGVGPMLGAGAANFGKPHEFVWETAKVIGQSFQELGRALAGAKYASFPEEPEYFRTMLAFSPIVVSEPFSAIDLNRSFGQLTMASAAMALGYSACYMSAFRLNRLYFGLQSASGSSVFGGTTGVSLGASANTGMWFAIS
jgi:hypothetical protein